MLNGCVLAQVHPFWGKGRAWLLGGAGHHYQMETCVIKACRLHRVYYSSSEKPEEVWAELADGSCRWRQTGSEIKIICLKVPLDSLA